MILKYISCTPENTNPAILKSMLQDYSGNISPEEIEKAVEKYLKENPIQSTPIDKTLTKSDQAAEAKAVGDILKQYLSIYDTIILDCNINMGG